MKARRVEVVLIPGSAPMVIEDLEMTVEEFGQLSGLMQQLIELEKKQVDQTTRAVLEASKPGQTGS